MLQKLSAHSFMAASLFLISLLIITILPRSVAAFTLTISNTGQGSGNINDALSCNIAPAGQCSATSLSGTVNLLAVADWKSLFQGWGSPCSGTGACTFDLTADTTVSATFTPNMQAIIVGHTISPSFATLTDAYTAANDQGTIAANVYIFHEDLVLADPKFVRLYLGKEPGFYYAAAIGFSTLHGSLDIRQGSVEIDSLIIE